MLLYVFEYQQAKTTCTGKKPPKRLFPKSDDEPVFASFPSGCWEDVGLCLKLYEIYTVLRILCEVIISY